MNVIMNYRNDIDLIKGISILAVILFHLSIIKTGYLGVDAFLVINGFLIIPPLLANMKSGGFSYIGFLRIVTIYPRQEQSGMPIE